jgi:hypothetical protein
VFRFLKKTLAGLSTPKQQSPEKPQENIEAGQYLDLSFTAASGENVDIQRLIGKVVAIDFWALGVGLALKACHTY